MQQEVVVRFFHELLLKGNNRSWFVRHLLANLNKALEGTGVSRLQLSSMLATFRFPDEEHWPLVRERLEQVIGVERFARCYSTLPTIEAVQGVLAYLLRGVTANSFRITTSRSDKSFPMTSPLVNKELGTFVHELTGIPVDLDTPDLNVRVQLLRRKALISFQEFSGLGGMPIGVGGRVACLLSGGIDSPVAAFQMMLRGCEVVLIHFHSFPLVDGTSREKVHDLARLLTRHQFRSRLLLVPFAPLQQRLIVSVPPAYRVVLYRRFMFRIAEELAIQNKAKALVTGESLGQVSSQTLENLQTITAVIKRLPVLRPFIGNDKAEIVARAERLGTYPISILPDQDCCSLFVPRHPVTRSRPQDAERLEEILDVEEMVREAVAATEFYEYTWPDGLRQHIG
jgi:thiamine biosynthesis protein ThiI